MPTESSIVRAIVAHLRAIPDSFVVKIHGSPFQQRGMPDILFLANGRLFAFEVKRPGGKATRIQTVVLDRIERAGGTARVVTSWNEVRGCLGHVLADKIK